MATCAPTWKARPPRACAVLDPLKLKFTNWAELFGSADHVETSSAPAHPHVPELGTRKFKMGSEVWIERDDFMEVPVKGYQRLFPGNKTRLKYGYVVECSGCEKDAEGRITTVLASIVPDTKSGTPGADAIKVKGVITWVGAQDAVAAEVRLYDRLFTEAQPDAGGRDFLEVLNPASLKVVQAVLEPSMLGVSAGTPGPVRAPRLLRGRPGRSSGREACLQQDHRPQDNWAK